MKLLNPLNVEENIKMIKYFQGYKLQSYDPFDFGSEKLATIKIVVDRSLISEDPLESKSSITNLPDGDGILISVSQNSPKDLENELVKDKELENEPGKTWGDSIDEDLEKISETGEIPPTSDEDFKAMFGSKVDNHSQESLETSSDNDVDIKKILIAKHDRVQNETIELGEFGSNESADLIKEYNFDPGAIQLVLDKKQKTHKGYKFEIEER